MQEIWIPELIIAFFLFFSLLQPLVKPLWGISGLIWLPLASLLITIGLFPAYGFRPECVPLLIFTFILTLVSIPSMIYSLGSHDGDFREPGLFITVPGFILFAAVTFTAFFYSPGRDLPELDGRFITRGLRETALRNGDREYFLRIYEHDGGNRPVLFLVPPEGGSVPAVDLICGGLRDRGFTVITYSRKGFDAPAAGNNRIYPLSPAGMRRLWRSFRSGTVSLPANELGRALESGRREDLDFLLLRIIQDYAPAGAPLLLAGYGAGGSALVLSAASPEFARYGAAVAGIIAVESVLWSAFEAEERKPREAPVGAGWFARTRTGTENWFSGLKPETVEAETAVLPALPVLFLVSDQVLGAGKDRYRGIYRSLQDARYPMALAAAEGAGPLDYLAYPATHPLYSTLFPGMVKTALDGPARIDNTVTLMTNFAARVLGFTGLEVRKAAVNLHIETRSWTLPDLRYILSP